jgi:hypothetical protein
VPPRAWPGPRDHRARAQLQRVCPPRHEIGASDAEPPEFPSNGPLNGWARLLGLVGARRHLDHLVWWLTQWLGLRIDRITSFEQIVQAEGDGS